MSDEKASNSLDLYTALKKEDLFSKLFPERRLGLAIALLFQKYGSRKFSETDIHNALKETSTTSSRHEWEQYGKAISTLQEFFVIYDQESQLYALTPYAEEYCMLALRRLQGRIDSTRIESICRSLLERLEPQMTETQLREWFDIQFETFRVELNEQVHYLDGQIREAVEELRQSSLVDADDVLRVLQNVDTVLGRIREKNVELRTAYRQLDTIREQLDKIAFGTTDGDLLNKVTDANDFFLRIRFVLRSVDQKLDRIQPKIRQLYANLNRPLINSSVERFLHYLLSNSEVSDSGIKLPEQVRCPTIQLRPAHFTIVERKEKLFPTMRRRMIVPTINPDTAERARLEHERMLLRQVQIDNQVEMLRIKLASEGHINVPEEFFFMMDRTGDDFGLCVHALHLLIEESRIHPERKLDIFSTMAKHPIDKQVHICEMTISHKA